MLSPHFLFFIVVLYHFIIIISYIFLFSIVLLFFIIFLFFIVIDCYFFNKLIKLNNIHYKQSVLIN